MRSFTPKMIAIASILAAVPLSGAYAAHRHHGAWVDTQTTASVPMSPDASAFYDQLQGVRQGIADARETGKISGDQARDLMIQADNIHRQAGASGEGYRSLLSQVDNLDQQLQNDTGQGSYIGSGGDGGYYPNG